MDSRAKDEVDSNSQEILITGQSMFEPEFFARRKRKAGTPVQEAIELAPKRLTFDVQKHRGSEADDEKSS